MAAVKLVDLIGLPPNQLPSQSDDATKTVGITKDLDGAGVIGLLQSTGIRHIVQKDGFAFEEELKTAEKMIREPDLFLDHPLDAIFGFDGDQSRKTFSFKCDASEKKTSVLTKFGDFVAGLKGSRSIWDNALLIGDELYTNSSKNAWDAGPTLFFGNPARNGQIEFTAQADGVRLVICCRDSFGTLDVEGVINRISTCYRNGVSQSIRHDTAGAGIGSHMVFESCVSYYAGSQKNKQSVVCVSLPLGLSRRILSGLCKNIHLL
jgi:hypothetical protein